MRYAFLLLALAGCSAGSAWNANVGQPPQTPEASSYKHQNLEVDKNVQPMSRNETILAIQECEANGTRPVMIYAKRKINGYTADIVVEVTCAPKFKTY
jgi:hypothetical protein